MTLHQAIYDGLKAKFEGYLYRGFDKIMLHWFEFGLVLKSHHHSYKNGTVSKKSFRD
jgi:hypothetical protein